MISGPITPLTPEGIRGYLRRHGDALESGLTLVGDGIEAGGRIVVDGIARDAHGDAAMLLFVLDETHPASRVLALREFLQRAGRSLGRSLSELGLRFDKGCRILLVGTHLSERWLADLEALALPSLEGWDVQILSVDGQRRLVVEPVLGLGAQAEDDLTVPAGVAEPELREACAEWLGIVARLDPAITVMGDRFSRTLSWSGQSLGRFVAAGSEARVEVPGFAVAPVRDRVQVADAADLVLRRYLAVAGIAVPVAPNAFEASAGGTLRVELDELGRSATGARVADSDYQASGRPHAEDLAMGRAGEGVAHGVGGDWVGSS